MEFSQEQLRDIGLGMAAGFAGAQNQGLSAAGRAMGATMLSGETRRQRAEARKQQQEDRASEMADRMTLMREGFRLKGQERKDIQTEEDARYKNMQGAIISQGRDTREAQQRRAAADFAKWFASLFKDKPGLKVNENPPVPPSSQQPPKIDYSDPKFDPNDETFGSVYIDPDVVGRGILDDERSKRSGTDPRIDAILRSQEEDRASSKKWRTRFDDTLRRGTEAQRREFGAKP